MIYYGLSGNCTDVFFGLKLQEIMNNETLQSGASSPEEK